MVWLGVRPRRRRENLEKRFKHVRNPDNPDDPILPLDIVLVRDMWLTGFDVPPLHTMLVSVQPAGTVSVMYLSPSCVPSKL